VAAGLQDDALHSLKIRSWGGADKADHITEGYRRVNGCMSAADPAIRGMLVEGGTLVKSLIWNPLSYAVVYGRSLDVYCVVQGLLMRKVPPTKILLVLPPRLKDASHQLPVDAFAEGDEVEEKIHTILKNMNMKVYEGFKLLGIQQDNRLRLKALVLEEHGVGDEAERLERAAAAAAAAAAAQQAAEAPGQTATSAIGGKKEEPTEPRIPEPKARCSGEMEDYGLSPDGFLQKLLPCRILITADSVNVDPDIFNSVHGNGLVYDGRLIVNHNFATTDSDIFGAGSLCEFSRRFRRKDADRYLRHDGFNGREVGSKLAQALLRVIDPVNGDMLAAGGAPRGLSAGSVGGRRAGGGLTAGPQPCGRREHDGGGHHRHARD